MSCFRAEKERWREEKRDQLREIGSDADAVVIDSHRAQLIAGKEWPGDKIVSPFPPELKAVAEQQGAAEGVFM